MLSFLRETSEERLDRIAHEMRDYDRSINLNSYVGRTPERLTRLITKLREDQQRTKRVAQYGSWLNDPKYMARVVMIEGIKVALEIRKAREAAEQLIEGQCVYQDVMEINNNLVGKRAIVTESGPSVWVDFKEALPVQKAIEVIRFGSPEDFHRIYVETANGRADALETITIQHLRESTADALDEIEKYCDSRWDGVWPWEARTPYRVETMIEEQTNMRIAEMAMMQGRFNSIMKKLNEDDMSKYELITAVTDMEDSVDSMVSGVAKLSAAGIEASAKASTSIGAETGAEIEQAWQTAVNQAAQALTSVKAQLGQIRAKVQASTSKDGMDMDGMDDGMSPDQAMGDPMGDPAIDDLAGVPLDHAKDERAMKPL